MSKHTLMTQLPAPRLQLRWCKADPERRHEWECHYELVLPLSEHDIRREVYDDDGILSGGVSEFVVPLKPPTRRRSSTATPCTARDGSRYYDPPYRDGAHAQWDAEALGDLPIYVIAPDGAAFRHEATGAQQ